MTVVSEIAISDPYFFSVGDRFALVGNDLVATDGRFVVARDRIFSVVDGICLVANRTIPTVARQIVRAGDFCLAMF